MVHPSCTPAGSVILPGLSTRSFMVVMGLKARARRPAILLGVLWS